MHRPGTSKTHHDIAPRLFPVPKLDEHVVRAGQNIRLGRVYSNASDIVAVGLERNDFFERVVVEDAELHVVRTGNDPRLPRNEFRSANRQVRDFKRFDENL